MTLETSASDDDRAARLRPTSLPQIAQRSGYAAGQLLQLDRRRQMI
jgi:hypothetical protein